MTEGEDKTFRLTVRFTEYLREEMQKSADDNGRSLNSEIVYQLEKIYMSNKTGRGSDQFPLRLPDGMRDAIKAAADKNGRSMNAEIIHMLEEVMEVNNVKDVVVDEEPILKFFEFTHLPPTLRDVSRPFHDLAYKVMELPRSAERSVALRKLLEAKDAAVRARL